MDNFELVKALIGETVTEDDLKYVDCYVHNKMGLFIPSTGPCLYALKPFHTHPSYMFLIMFSLDSVTMKPLIETKDTHYLGIALSPDIPHSDHDMELSHYYCILIDKEYFEEQYKLYSDKKPVFNWNQFLICHDILKTLNTFAFEYSKQMQNSDITLDAQATIITHWLIRSLLGENYDMRAISSNYAIARAEHYIEQHFSDTITVKQLAELGNMSVSTFNRSFKRETKLTPIEYLIEIRIQKSKKLLRRKEIPITEVAMRCGFGSSSHFASCFSKFYKITPTDYRKAYIDS